MTIMPISA